jgi:hypothetical protein
VENIPFRHFFARKVACFEVSQAQRETNKHGAQNIPTNRREPCGN